MACCKVLMKIPSILNIFILLKKMTMTIVTFRKLFIIERLGHAHNTLINFKKSSISTHNFLKNVSYNYLNVCTTDID